MFLSASGNLDKELKPKKICVISEIEKLGEFDCRWTRVSYKKDMVAAVP